jgi:membrane fusion protein, heavy metal efflux system
MSARMTIEQHPLFQGLAFGLLLATALALLGTAGCGRSWEPAHSASDDKESLQPSLFSVPPEQMAHLQVVAVKKSDWGITVRTTGTVDWDNDHTTQAITQVSGPITRILVDAGTYVHAGQPLLYVNSPDITNAIAAYRVASNHLHRAKTALDRNSDLLAHHAIAQKDMENAEADYNDANTQVQSSLQALTIFGITQKELVEAEKQGLPINPQLAVRSPISGTIVQKMVMPGQFIQAGVTTCFLISDVSTVWVQGHIHEKDLTSIRLGDIAEETNSSLPGVHQGTISYIGAMIDPATRTTPVRIVTRNPGGLLKKDLFMDVVIRTKIKKGVLTVPSSAILYNSENQPFVYLRMDAGKFGQRLVKVGAQQSNQNEILEGLGEGDQVVSEGSLFLQFANSYQR